MSGTSRRRAIGLRWLWILALAVCGALVGTAVLSLRIPFPEWLGENWSLLVTGTLGYAICIAFWTAILSIGPLRTAFSWQNHRQDYPSCAVAVRLVAMVGTVYAACSCWQKPITGADYYTTYRAIAFAAWNVSLPFLALVAGYSLRDGWTLLVSRLSDKTKAGASFPSSSPGLPTDLAWILDERPVENLESDDHFERGPVVRRLARILLEADGRGSTRSIGLIGGYGSGKTTIVRFVENELGRGAQSMLFVPVPSWGVAERGLTGFVLERAIDALQEHRIDCLALRGLPQQYLAAIGVANERMGRLAQAFCGAPSPETVLQRLHPILAALNLRLVLCVEDAERSAGERALQNLAGMLDRFPHIDGVSFIVEANRNSSSHLDLFRLCDHVEIVPRMPAMAAWNCLRALRQACVQLAESRGDVLPAEEALDPQSRRPVRIEDAFWDEWIETGSLWSGLPQHALMQQLALAVGTPRVLKHALRRVWLDWQQLHGEADLRDVILLNVLREVAPEALQFVVSNISPLRGIAYVGADEEGRTRRGELQRRWQQLVASQGRDWDPDAAFSILGALDLDFQRNQPHVVARGSVSQSIHQFGTDYLQRVLAGEVDGSAEVRDQTVLRELAAWQNGEGGDPAEHMLKVDGYAEKVEQFQSLLGTDEQKLRLCSEYLGYVLRRHGDQASGDCRGFDSFRRIVGRVSSGGGTAVEWWEQQITAATEVSPRMVDALHMVRDWPNADQ